MPVLRINAGRQEFVRIQRTPARRALAILAFWRRRPDNRIGYDPAAMAQSRPRAALQTVPRIACDLLRLALTAARSHAQLAAENLFLKKQLALYLERHVKPRRADDATRIVLVALSWLIDWRHVLTVVKPETLIRWHRKGFQLFWRWKSRPCGRPRLPADLRRLIAAMAAVNRTWGEERIASELLVKLGIRVSPRTVRRYMSRDSAPRGGARLQTWSTFVRNHASAMLACDFCVAVTATFRVFYVFVVLDVGTRRILHSGASACSSS